MAATLASLVPLLIFARIFALLVAVLVFVWALAFSSSFHHRSPSREDHIFDVLHPLFMVIGLILLSGEAILVHSWLPGSRNLRKSVHLSLQGLALASGIIGIWTKFHRDRSFLANFHSLHSWMGLLAVTLFGAQWMMGFLSFWHWREVRGTRERVLPWHVFVGLYSYGLAVATAETGLLEKLTLLQTKRNVPKKGPEAMVVNSLGLALALLSGIVILTAISPKYPPSLPSKHPFFSNSKLLPS
ncbi:probable transmembrane ascorbate ferrireductase 4 isoform X1 [Momordica charantia]|uniref:ascorbate ferrireductase (transmembrane) n=1 Tax=Momordica charantia TaxID=3673 RepID=A0A6J1DAT7_MOMCH|nr:probable transmembrane ascorbate ferrireductase 4 isoform X1 [Momordica charantia]